MTRQLFFWLIFFAFIWSTKSLLMPVMMGALFAVVCFPILERMEKRMSTPLASIIITIGLTFLVFLPLIFMIFYGAKTGFEQFSNLKESGTFVRAIPEGGGARGDWVDLLLSAKPVKKILDSISSFSGISTTQFSQWAHEIARTVITRGTQLLATFLANIPSAGLALLIVILSTYFGLADGRRMQWILRRNTWLSAQETEQLIHTVASLSRSVILAVVLAGVAQTFIYSTAALFLGLDNVPFICLLVFIASFTPLVGSAPVTFSIAIYQLLTGTPLSGIGMLIAAVLVSCVDNLVRPIVMKGGSNLHPMLAFIGALGGLKAFGMSGIFLGPVLAGLFVETLAIVADTKSKPPQKTAGVG